MTMGVPAVTVTDPEMLGAAWETAFAARTPTLLDVHVDPDVPPVPPHVTPEQMKDLAASLLKGDERRWGVLVEGLKTKAQELLPGQNT
jgi:pyruvate dehydrogenase (quinone)